jgi:hypothetical protein
MKTALLYLLLTLNLFADTSISGFSVLPRQDNVLDGNIAKYELYSSMDGKNWGAAVASGVMSNDKTLKKINFPTINSNFVKLKVLTEGNGSNNTNISEINVIDKNGNNLDRKDWKVSADSSTPAVGSPFGGPLFAIDGNPNTFWITDWKIPAPLPHEYVIDLGVTPIAPPIDTTLNVAPNFAIKWDANPEPNIAKYVISYGFSSGNYTKHIDVVGKLRYEFVNMDTKKTYLSLVAVNTDGLISEPSDELVANVVIKNFPSAPMPLAVESPARFIDILMSVPSASFTSIGKVPYPLVKGQRYKTNIVSEIDPAYPDIKKYIHVSMSIDGGATFKVIGKIAYPYVKGQKYKSALINSINE